MPNAIDPLVTPTNATSNDTINDNELHDVQGEVRVNKGDQTTGMIAGFEKKKQRT